MEKMEDGLRNVTQGDTIMSTIEPADPIRQQRTGTFRVPGDGQKPFAYVNDQKFVGVKRRLGRSIYVGGEKVGTLEKGVLESDFPRLFDHQVGLNVDVEKKTATAKSDLSSRRQTSEKTTPRNDEGTFIDAWA